MFKLVGFSTFESYTIVQVCGCMSILSLMQEKSTNSRLAWNA